MLARLILFASAHRIKNSAKTFKHEVEAPAWKNLFEFVEFTQEFVVLMPDEKLGAGAGRKISLG